MIIADDRERGSGVIEYLRSMGISVNIDRLEVGDYIISKEICIERKTVNDLINSIIDKRLSEQSRHLVLAFEKVYLIVEGDIDYTLRYRKIDLRQIYGALASVSELGIRLMFTKDPRQTATFLYVLHKRMKKSVRRYLPPTKIKVMKDSKSLPLVQLNLIASLPGISVELAEKILRHFKTPRKFFRASSFELKSVEGLGDKRVKKILEVLDTMYQPTVDKQLRES